MTEDDFDRRMMRQIIGVSNESELRVEWDEDQLHSPTFSAGRQSLFTPAPSSPPSTKPPPEKSTFSSLIDCPPELASLQTVETPPIQTPGLGPTWSNGHYGKRQRLRMSLDKYYSHLKSYWYH